MNVVQVACAAALLTRAGDWPGAALLLDGFAETATADELDSVRRFVELFDWPGLAGGVPSSQLQDALLAEAAA